MKLQRTKWIATVALLAAAVLLAGTTWADETNPKSQAWQQQEPKKDAKAADAAQQAKATDQPAEPQPRKVTATRLPPGQRPPAPPAQGDQPAARRQRSVTVPLERPGKPNRPKVPTETPTGPVTGAPGFRCAQTLHDFGLNWLGGSLDHVFIVRNEGDQELEILSVKPSCGCTVAKNFDRKIPPGGQGKIPVSINTKKVYGKFTKSITVNTNDPATPALRLRISGLVKRYVETQPRRVNFSHIKDTTAERTLIATLTNNTEQSFVLHLASPATSGPFKAELVLKEEGKVYELHVTAQGPYQPKLNAATFKVATNLPQQRTFDVPVSAYVPPRLDVRPEKMILGPATDTQLIRPIRFINNGTTLVKVLSADINDERLQAQLVERVVGKNYEIKLTIPAGYAPPAGGRVLTLRTDDAERPEIKIPVTGRPKKAKRTYPAEKLLGRAAPKASFTTFEGKTLATGEPSGKVTVLDFYASWCGFCKKQIPKVSELYARKYADNPNVRFLAVSADQLKSAGATGPRARTDEQVAQMFSSLGAKFESALDPKGDVKGKFLVGSFPTLMLLGKNGVVEAVHFGAKANLSATLEKQIDLLLADKTRADFPGAITPAPPGIKAAAQTLRGGGGTPAAAAPTPAKAKVETKVSAKQAAPAQDKATTGSGTGK